MRGSHCDGGVMSKLLWLALVLLGVMIVGATSRSDDLGTATEAPPSIDLSFPAKVPLGPNPPRDPNTPYDVGPPDAVWSYEQLSPADKAVADRGRDTTGWQAVHDEYAAASAQRAETSKAELAAALLGLQGLGDTGVVP